jgi:hypothetical protein
MIETSTQSQIDITNNADEIMSSNLTFEVSEDNFYNSIKPNLNKITMNPSDKIINQILDFSKSN